MKSLFYLALFSGLASASASAHSELMPETFRSVYFNTTEATSVAKVVTGIAVTGAIYSYLLYAATVLVERFSDGSGSRSRR